MSTVEEMLARRREYPSYKNRKQTRSKEPSYTRHYRKNLPYVDYAKREFISWDGEGADIDGVHQYIMLMNNKGQELIMEDGIPTQIALEFLCKGKQDYPDGIHVVFGGSYDVNMILRDLPYKYIKILQKKHRVFWQYFNIHYIPRKYFSVSRYERVRGDKRKKKPIVTITMWDTIGFFQGTFVKSLKEYFPDEEFQRDVLRIPQIEEGKKRRGTFSPDELMNFVLPYTRYEVDALTMLMNKLRENFLEAGIQLSRWDGAGAAAAAVLKKYNVKKYYPKLTVVNTKEDGGRGDGSTDDEDEEDDEQPVNMLTNDEKAREEAGQRAFGGGHVEMYMYGHTEPGQKTHHYDVIGAYPSVMPLLVNLANGQWRTHRFINQPIINSADVALDRIRNNFSFFTMYKVYWDYRYRHHPIIGVRTGMDTDNVMYPFFYRQPYKDARIFYPEQGYNWVWGPEVEVALKHHNKLGGELRILEAWEFIPGDDIKPFGFVSELYKKRLEYKALLMGAALALKLAVNSFYGKTAQTVGYEAGDGMRRPPFYNIHYAGFITSYIRAKMFDAMMQAPDKIIAVATDGLWSLVPLDLPVGKNMGEWEYEVLDSFTSVQAGVYFATKQSGEQIYHYRGFNQGSIQEDDVLSSWERRDYSLPIKTRRFVTMGTAVASEKRFKEHWRRWEDDTRLLELYAGGRQKRMADVMDDGRPDPRAAKELLPTMSNPVYNFQNYVKTFDDVTENLLSRKHPLPWDKESRPTEHEEKMTYDEEVQWEITESEV